MFFCFVIPAWFRQKGRSGIKKATDKAALDKK